MNGLFSIKVFFLSILGSHVLKLQIAQSKKSCYRQQRLVLRHPQPQAISDTSTDINHWPQVKGNGSCRLNSQQNHVFSIFFYPPIFKSRVKDVWMWGWAPPAVMGSGRAPSSGNCSHQPLLAVTLTSRARSGGRGRGREAETLQLSSTASSQSPLDTSLGQLWSPTLWSI